VNIEKEHVQGGNLRADGKDMGEKFCEVVGNVNQGINPFKADVIAFHQFAQCKVFDVNVPCSDGGFLGVAHGSAAIVVFVCYYSRFLGNIKTCGQCCMRP
jgi:hypothetical protein